MCPYKRVSNSICRSVNIEFEANEGKKLKICGLLCNRYRAAWMSRKPIRCDCGWVVLYRKKRDPLDIPNTEWHMLVIARANQFDSHESCVWFFLGDEEREKEKRKIMRDGQEKPTDYRCGNVSNASQRLEQYQLHACRPLLHLWCWRKKTV